MKKTTGQDRVFHERVMNRLRILKRTNRRKLLRFADRLGWIVFDAKGKCLSGSCKVGLAQYIVQMRDAVGRHEGKT